MHSTHAFRFARRGISLVYAVLFMTAGVAIASLMVDFGRVQVAKAQLQDAADSAARAAVVNLGNVSATQDAAAQYAAANNCDGTPVAIDKTNDVQFVSWDSTARTYTVLSGANQVNANAVRVSCSRTGNNGITLMFGKLLGMTNCNASASAIAYINPSSYGLVGLNYIKLSGSASMSYFSSNGNVGGNAAGIASNGNITSSGTAAIHGTVWTQSGATVSGVTAASRKTLSAPLSYPNGSPGTYSKINNDDANITPSGLVNNTPDLNISGKTATLPAGNYYFHNVAVSGSGKIVCTGVVNIYYYGTFAMSGSTQTYGNIPGNLTITAVPTPTGAAPGTLTLSGSSAMYANVYAPQSDITLSGSGDIHGWVIGKSITLSGSANMYYDLSSPSNGGAIQLVK
jgi:Flp pilus assembly protein TadG